MKIKIDENKLQEIVAESTKKYLKEAFQMPYLDQKFAIATSKLETSYMLNALHIYLEQNELLEDFLDWVATTYEINIEPYNGDDENEW